MAVSGEYMEIGSNTWEKNDMITLSATDYNINKKTGWKLPRDIVTSYTEIPKKFEIQRVGLPKEMSYQVKMSGYKDLSPSDIRWYMRKLDTNSGGCDINTWNAKTWKKVSVSSLAKYSNNTSSTETYRLDMSKYPSSACIVA